ncbi:Hsp20-like chaperones superfamily protein [Thalictrum thalictroides]|uniref:Hsp20-like chaperones superfamily protein n=1 Tax=Thalictrum thalictroides TaxID=46969 RepID=A0A7J6VTG3_THATH|nr:Hsp20-like chaperones superfamily protein [Thalictrum thalictroides]
MAEKLAPEKRHSFIHGGQKVFEWDQTIDEVNIYITLPPNHDLTCPVKTDSSFWTLEDDIMHITLQKRDIGQTWASPILGQGQLDPVTTDLEQKRLMLQRFQEEVISSVFFGNKFD